MLIYTHSIQEPANAGLSYQGPADRNKYYQQEDNLITFCQVVSYLLQNYEADRFIAGADRTNLKQPVRLTAVCSSEVLWEKHFDVAVHTMH